MEEEEEEANLLAWGLPLCSWHVSAKSTTADSLVIMVSNKEMGILIHIPIQCASYMPASLLAFIFHCL